VNEEIAFFAAEPDEPEICWAFVCECGSPACSELVELPLSSYEEIRASRHACVLAAGHTASPSQRARAEAEELREEGSALRAQATLQRERAKVFVRRWG